MPENYWGNVARSFGQGLLFSGADELEAAVRAAAQGDPSRYRAIKAQINRDYGQFAEKHPAVDATAQIAGALVPGLMSGGSSLAGRAAMAVDAPLTALMSRYAPRLAARAVQSRLGRLAVPVLDETINGAASAVGNADTVRDIPSKVAEDLPWLAVQSLAVRGATGGGKALYRKVRGR